MKQFSAELYYLVARAVETISRVTSDDQGLVPEGLRVSSHEILRQIRGHCAELGLRMSVKYLDGTALRLFASPEKRPTGQKASEVAGILQDRIQDEISLRTFLYIPDSKDQYFQQTEPLLGRSVQDAFPSITQDIEEAGKCYALGRNTACVFHLQRALEVGLKVLAKTLGLPFNRNSWNSHLKDIESELERRYKAAGGRSPDELFYSEAAAQFSHIKTAWRNPTMHIEKSYSDEVALDVLTATRSFLRHLATKLKE